MPITLGTQTGGSLIRPASFNGVYAMKPTWGAISREGVKIYSVMLDSESYLLFPVVQVMTSSFFSELAVGCQCHDFMRMLFFVLTQFDPDSLCSKYRRSSAASRHILFGG